MGPILFYVEHTQNSNSIVKVPVPEAVATSPYSKDNTRYFVKVMLFSGPGPEDDKTKGKVHLTKRLNFLLVRKEHGGVAPIGGEWSSAKDGAKPDDAALKKTAIRVTKELVGIDLSKCTEWLKFVEFAYKKEDQSSACLSPDMNYLMFLTFFGNRSSAAH